MQFNSITIGFQKFAYDCLMVLYENRILRRNYVMSELSFLGKNRASGLWQMFQKQLKGFNFFTWFSSSQVDFKFSFFFLSFHIFLICTQVFLNVVFLKRVRWENQHFLQESTLEENHAFKQCYTRHWATTHLTFNQKKYT